jgi:hypothetical protein
LREFAEEEDQEGREGAAVEGVVEDGGEGEEREGYYDRGDEKAFPRFEGQSVEEEAEGDLEEEKGDYVPHFGVEA